MINKKTQLFNILFSNHGKRYLRQRLSPRVIDPYFFVHKSILKALKIAINHSASNADVLDVGSGTSPYRQLFRSAQKFTAIDGTEDLFTEKADLESEWFRGEYDIVLCLDVIEHIYNFENFIFQLKKSVKQDGLLIISIPFSFPVHGWDYNDYWRLTDQALLKKFHDFDLIKKINSNSIIINPILKIIHLIFLIPVPMFLKNILIMPLNSLSLFLEIFTINTRGMLNKIFYSDPLEYVFVFKKKSS